MMQWFDSMTTWLQGSPYWLALAIFLVACLECLAVAGIVMDHFDGLDTFDDLPRDGRCVADMWF